ncbi:uncharacterized protein LOC132696931 [Cylas formicarius]|uniref:uncharacterized protein LOC132696931 n=1 Tax=Cylas formicarius TaxID=197179 RepID=UPI0029584C75|nr:uncharacterized protein LOC132696931 [Cylas formicarius]
MMSTVNKTSSKRLKNLLGYELNFTEDATVNYLVPAASASVLYMFIIAGDIAVIFRHYKDYNPIWGNLTLSIMYLPALGSYLFILSNSDYWPQAPLLRKENIIWLLKKTSAHLLFPIWSMWRFAERIFWSIEVIRSKDEFAINEAISIISAPRTIELYIFLQAYMHSLLQVLLQLYILMRHNANIERESKDAQVFCIVFNLAKVAITTTFYQRFKSQKIAGSQYPWYKSKTPKSLIENQEVILRNSGSSQSRSVIENRKTELNRMSKLYQLLPSLVSQRRRSSDIYLEPTATNTDLHEFAVTKHQNDESGAQSTTEFDGIRRTSKESLRGQEVNSEVRGTTLSNRSEPDLNIARIIYIKGLQEDDLAGRLIAFCWWFTFLLGRVLAISVFAYFFVKETIWLLTSHFVLVLAFLIYDVKSNEVRRAKAFFFIFLGIIYIFCIIEFKIKFKKAYFIYSGYFTLVFLENFTMCLVWYYGQLESLETDYWFRYTFYVVVGSSLLSLCSMIFYLTLTKPKSVLIPTTLVNSRNSS